MFTTCTHCGSRFRLNVAQLTAAQGHVRCGKCGEVFDAYEVLEGADVPPKMPEPAAPPAAEEQDDSFQIDVGRHGAGRAAERDEVPELPSIIIDDDEPITSAPNLKAGSRKSKLPIDDLFEGIAEDHAAPGSDKPDAVQSPEPDASPQEPAGLSYPAETESAPEAGELPAGGSPRSFAHVDDLHTPPAPKPRRPLLSATAWIAVLLLALALLAQLVDIYRQPLSQNPVIGPSLQALYARLGRPLTGAGSVSQWSVDALNVTTDPDSGGALSITGSLTNGSGLTQPWPLLRVVLTDRFGEALRSRDFKPAEYLLPGKAGTQLASGLSARFRLDVVDPGAEAVGFSLTPCMDVTGGRTCAAPNTAD